MLTFLVDIKIIILRIIIILIQRQNFLGFYTKATIHKRILTL